MSDRHVARCSNSTSDARIVNGVENGMEREDRNEDKDDHCVIRLCTYNIRDGRNGGLESTLPAMDEANVDVGVLQETKLPLNIYTRWSSGYHVITTAAPTQHQGGLTVIYRSSEQWQLEAYQTFSHNVISFQLMSDRK